MKRRSDLFCKHGDKLIELSRRSFFPTTHQTEIVGVMPERRLVQDELALDVVGYDELDLLIKNNEVTPCQFYYRSMGDMLVGNGFIFSNSAEEFYQKILSDRVRAFDYSEVL